MESKIKILIACEYSGIVSSAFANRGFDVTSCDLLPSDNFNNHYIGDVMDIINNGFDMLIGFPPCTYLTYAGNHVWSKEDRVLKRLEAAKFFMDLYLSNIKHVVIENPMGIMYKIYRVPDQVIHPYYFSGNEMKRICLWLRNLPKLKYELSPTLFEPGLDFKNKPEPLMVHKRRNSNKIKKRYGTDALNSVKSFNQHERSRFFPEIAEQMAIQWGDYILKQKTL